MKLIDERIFIDDRGNEFEFSEGVDILSIAEIDDDYIFYTMNSIQGDDKCNIYKISKVTREILWQISPSFSWGGKKQQYFQENGEYESLEVFYIDNKGDLPNRLLYAKDHGGRISDFDESLRYYEFERNVSVEKIFNCSAVYCVDRESSGLVELNSEEFKNKKKFGFKGFVEYGKVDMDTDLDSYLFLVASGHYRYVLNIDNGDVTPYCYRKNISRMD
jgi:hypothetical protein